MSAISDIEKIQTLLYIDFPEIKVDGDIGKITRACVRSSANEVVREIQKVLAHYDPMLKIDGLAGPKTMQSLDELDELGDIESLMLLKRANPAFASPAPPGEVNHVIASSFAYEGDVKAFRQCKLTGKSDRQCFKVGDNGIGAWGALCATESACMAALPREIWRASGKTGGALLEVSYQGQAVTGILGDTMPALENITNGAGIDLNPGFARAFDLPDEFLYPGFTWRWV